MFRNNNHGFFCCCPSCKHKRKNSLCYMGFLSCLFIIFIYQLFIILIFTTKLNAWLLFMVTILFFIWFIRIFI